MNTTLHDGMILSTFNISSHDFGMILSTFNISSHDFV